MAEYKLYNFKDPKTGQEEPQLSSKEEFDTLKQKVKPDQIKNPRTGQQGSAESVVKENDNQADAVNVAKDIAKTLRDALKEHGDEMQGIFLKDMNTRGVTVKVTYKPDEQGQQTEDEFVFRWDNGNVRLDNLANPVDLGQIQNKSGRAFIQKDLLKDKLLAFLNSHEEGPAEIASDPGQIPDGQPISEEWPDDHIGGQDEANHGDDYQDYETQSLWESEECQEAFCNAVTNFRNNAKDKETIKNLLKAARPFQKGNTIQEKLKGAVDWYNWFTENPPKNTKKQVFLEKDQEGDDEELLDIAKSIAQGVGRLKEYVNNTENTHLGAFYRDLAESLTRLYTGYLGCVKPDFLDEYGWYPEEDENPFDGDEAERFANRPRPNYDDEDEPALDEYDEFGPEIGDEVDYNEGKYKLYGYCGYEVVLQNVDDERDFKVVKPVDIGMGTKKQVKETEYIDPEQLPDDQEEQI